MASTLHVVMTDVLFVIFFHFSKAYMYLLTLDMSLKVILQLCLLQGILCVTLLECINISIEIIFTMFQLIKLGIN